MLVLSRCRGEGIVLTLPSGERVTATVISIVQGVVRLAIDAPRHIPVHREEVQWKLDGQSVPS